MPAIYCWSSSFNLPSASLNFPKQVEARVPTKPMSKIEHPEIPKRRVWSSWSVIRKAQVFGSAIGVSITAIWIVISLALVLFDNSDPVDGPLGFWEVVSAIVTFPGELILIVFGLPDHGVTNVQLAIYLSLAVVINGIILFTVGSVIGWFLIKRKRAVTES